MTLQTRLTDFITAIGTDIKLLRTYITGSSTGDLSGLTTTSKTSIISAINEVKSATASVQPDATTSTKGIVLLATDAQTTTGTDTTHATTPSNITAAFTARIATSTALGTSDVLVPSQNAVKAYADALIGANDAMVFKGVIDASASPNYPASNRGDTYKVSVAGKIGGASGPNVEVGDILMAITDGTASGTQAAVGAQWTIVQNNIDGAVVGPTSSTASDFAMFSGTTGKVIQDSGVSLDTDGTLAANSATRVPSQSAVKTYAQPLSANLTSLAAVASTTYGRAFLALVNQAGLIALLPTSSEGVAGIIPVATQAITNAVTSDVTAVSPLKLGSYITTTFGNPDTDLAGAYTTAKT